MPIAFTTLPTNNRVPGAYAEADGSRAVSSQAHDPAHVLLIGYRTSAAPVLAGVVTPITGETEADAKVGAKSQLAAMARAFRRVNKTSRLSILAVDEDAGGTAASGTVTVTGPATANGTLTVRVGDVRVSVGVTNGQAATAIATALGAAINAAERIPFGASVAGAVVTLTAPHKGAAYNGLTAAVESAPAGVGGTIVQPTGGATDASLAASVALLDDETYDLIVPGITAATALAALEVEVARRWEATVKLHGHIIGAVVGDHAAHTTLGTARNSQFSTIMGAGLSPTPPWIWAAQVAGRNAQRWDAGTPNRPRKGMTLPDCEAPTRASGTRFDYLERNLLLNSGISTFTVDKSGMVSIDRLITTYRTNAAGQSDTTYLSIETVQALAFILREWLIIASKYSDAMVGRDGDDYAPGVPVLTPKAFTGEITAKYKEQVWRGLAKDYEGFKESAYSEINASSTDRIDFHGEPRIVQGLVTLAMQASFRV